jgi:hypothetical protein
VATNGTRIEEARRRAAVAKKRLGAVAAASFLAAGVLAYLSHPGSAKGSSTGGSGAATSDDAGIADDQFDFNGGAIGPSSGFAPQVQTHVS